MTTDIEIRYINATSKVDFAVVVFTKNFSVLTHKMFYSALQVLKGQIKALLISSIQSPHQLELHMKKMVKL